MSLTDTFLLLIAVNTLMISTGVWYLVGSRHAGVRNK